MEENLKNIVNIALELTKAAGCNATRAGAEISVQSSFSVRNNTLDRLQSSTGSTLFIQLFIDGRFGFYSTNRTEIDELKEFISKAAEATRLIAPDPDRILPPRELLFYGKEEDLGQFDSKYPAPYMMLQLYSLNHSHLFLFAPVLYFRLNFPYLFLRKLPA